MIVLSRFFSRLPSFVLVAIFCSLGVEAAEIKGEGSFTCYYMASVKRAGSGSGVTGKATDRDGSRVSYAVTGGTHRVMEMQATVSVRQEDGSRKVYSRLKRGEWVELPADHYGLGNRDNPLVPFRIIAADQSIHPFGSRVFVPEIKGVELEKGKPHDGVFWVGDTGGRIKGKFRFDLFVGDHVVFLDFFRTRGGGKKTEVQVQNSPKPPPPYSVRTLTGVRHILKDFWKRHDEIPAALKAAGEPKGDAYFKQALISFQKQHEQIPDLEYGNRNGAATTWFLAVSAVDLGKQSEKNP
jgi:3D (Asp-Asp-Asp) domain-containing protein